MEVYHPYLEYNDSNFLALKYFKGCFPPHLYIKYSYNDNINKSGKNNFISYFGIEED